ncbi:DMT family transporter [Ichthyenterobacterium magnum]|uniref:EamA-like transporter family protein n=1 Tax=Ichthyenterobacterium magnum TaxID=1230530 RepID=A0A420DLE3_9FLAO|nr:DMT family transporter [Ichthyenterobacterium magnum]RKE95063.1 EamA-like transporter family protein [Ichthyenterobacterium magnum]
MIYLLLSITASTLIFIIFKLFNYYKIDTLQAIVTNYIIACIYGLLSCDASIQLTEIANAKWFYGAFALGFLFIFVFNIMALTAQRNGLSVASVASKMSVIIPIIFGIYVYNESVGTQKILGILLALIAVYLASVKSKTKINFKKNLRFPLLLFIGAGTIDTSIKYLETTYVAENGVPLFSATIFAFAGIIGLSILIFKIAKRDFRFESKNIYGGIILGIVNYYSIIFLLKALNFEGAESSSIFTVNNVAIVMLSCLLGLFFFKERITKKNWLGIGLAIVSIFLVTLA